MLTTEQDEDALVSKAEVRIQKVLIDLYNELGLDVESVNVDLRAFANYAVEIIIREPEYPPR
jgi:hypothetical protein